MIREEELIERLLAQQPSAKTTLERLRVRFEGKSGYGAFAPIRNRGYEACKMTIAWGAAPTRPNGRGYHLRQLRSLPLHRRR